MTCKLSAQNCNNQKAIREQEQKAADNNLANFHAIMARNKSRWVTTKKNHPHICKDCGVTYQGGSRMWFSPGRIAAKSSRNNDAVFTASTYTCKSCYEGKQ